MRVCISPAVDSVSTTRWLWVLASRLDTRCTNARRTFPIRWWNFDRRSHHLGSIRRVERCRLEVETYRPPAAGLVGNGGEEDLRPAPGDHAAQLPCVLTYRQQAQPRQSDAARRASVTDRDGGTAAARLVPDAERLPCGRALPLVDGVDLIEASPGDEDVFSAPFRLERILREAERLVEGEARRASSQHVAHETPSARNHGVHFGREPAARSAEGLAALSASRPRRMRMRLYDCAVDQQQLVDRAIRSKRLA